MNAFVTDFDTQYKKCHVSSAYRVADNGVGLYSIPEFDRLGWINHGFSSRIGGISTGFLSSLNLSFTRAFEPRDITMENYRIFCAGADIPVSSMVMDSYEHGATVRYVDRNDCGAGYTRPALPFCDGLVTDDPAVTLVTGHADCMPFYFIDPVHKAIGLAHAGWRGALKRIGASVIDKMAEMFSTRPSDVLCAVGPSICFSCFEVGEDVAKLFVDAFPYDGLYKQGKPGKAYIDLWRVAAAQMMEKGVLPSNIYLMGVCTYEDDKLYSHRRDRGNTGGMSAYLGIISV